MKKEEGLSFALMAQSIVAGGVITASWYALDNFWNWLVPNSAFTADYTTALCASACGFVCGQLLLKHKLRWEKEDGAKALDPQQGSHDNNR